MFTDHFKCAKMFRNSSQIIEASFCAFNNLAPSHDFSLPLENIVPSLRQTNNTCEETTFIAPILQELQMFPQQSVLVPKKNILLGCQIC